MAVKFTALYGEIPDGSVTEEKLSSDLQEKFNKINQTNAIENKGVIVHEFKNYTSKYNPNSTIDNTIKGLWSENGVKITCNVNSTNKLYNVNLSLKANTTYSLFYKVKREEIGKLDTFTIQAQTSSETIIIFNTTWRSMLDGWNCNKFIVTKDLEITNLIITINCTSEVEIIFDTIKTDFRLKPKVLLCFDNSSEYSTTENQLVLVDGFKPLLEERGFRGTFALQSGGYPEIYSSTITYKTFWTMLANGWDFAYYNGLGERPSEDTLNDTSYYETWNKFINDYKDLLEEKGIFNPFTYFARFNNASSNINNTLKANGTKMMRMANSVKTITYFDKESFEIPCLSATDNVDYSFKIDVVKTLIDQCIANGECICLLCHALEDIGNETASSSSYCSKNGYIELLDYIKNYVDNNQLEVVTFKEFYSSFYPKETTIYENGRYIKRSYWLEEKINNL